MRQKTLFSAASISLLCFVLLAPLAVKAGPPQFLGDRFAIPALPTAPRPPVTPVTGRRMTNIPTCYLYFDYRHQDSPQVTSGPPMPVPKVIFVNSNAFHQSAVSSCRIVSKHQIICGSAIVSGGTNSKTRPSPAGSMIKP